jgi:uncharacterized protein
MIAWIRPGLATLALVLVTTSASAQSFNCARATFPDEDVICERGDLSALDETLSDLYYRVLSMGGISRARLKREQARWLRRRHACGYNGACIARKYRIRIDELRNYLY